MYPMIWSTFWWHNAQPFERYGVKVIDPPSAEFFDVPFARDHLRADPTAGDETIIESQIAAARQWCEGYMARSFCRQTLELGLPRFPGHWVNGDLMSGFGFRPTWIDLPTGPVRGIVSVSYTEDGGATYTDLDPSVYILDDYGEPPRLYLAPGQSWPTTQWGVPNSVKVRYVAGYDLDSDSPDEMRLPPLAKQAMLLMLGHFYENRETEVVADSRVTQVELTTGAKALLDMVPRGRLRTGIA